MFALPPQIARFPLRFPLSQLKGAKPTNAAISLLDNFPNSGNSAIRHEATCSPIPLTDCSNSLFSLFPSVFRNALYQGGKKSNSKLSNFLLPSFTSCPIGIVFCACTLISSNSVQGRKSDK